jgi:ubiquinone/menaquinone biosynthesis C-methylase UbiE
LRLGWAEKWLINNPVRPLVQEALEARQLLHLGGTARNAKALEFGCGSGSGIGLLFKYFEVGSVDAFDVDFGLVRSAAKQQRLKSDQVKLWVGNVRRIPVADAYYDAVFDFGTLHHVHDWQSAIKEVRRVLKPGGRFFVEEITRQFIVHTLWRKLLDHPQENRFDLQDLVRAHQRAGFVVRRSRRLAGLFIWCVADRN